MSVLLQVYIWCHTGQGSVSRTKQKSSGQHEGQQVCRALKMRPQCKDSWSQHSQEGEQENTNYRRGSTNTYIELHINTYWRKFRWISKQLVKDKERFIRLTAVSQLINEESRHDDHHSIPGKTRQDEAHLKAEKQGEAVEGDRRWFNSHVQA